MIFRGIFLLLLLAAATLAQAQQYRWIDKDGRVQLTDTPPPKAGQYDPSGLTGPAPKPGQYGVPGESK